MRYAEGLFVSGDFFRGLSVMPALGRVLTADDDRAACPSPPAVLSYAFWQREFGGATGVLGRSVMLNGRVFPVVGVTSANFFGVEVGHRFDIAIPLCADPLFTPDGKGRSQSPINFWLSIMGRLKPGWTVARASAHFRALSPALMQATVAPAYRADFIKLYLANKLGATPAGTGVSELREFYGTPLWLLLATTGLVLLLARANLANLLLTRASTREREVAVRLSIGASRRWLIRQFLTEGLMLAGMGAALGVGLAQALSRALVSLISTADSPLFLGVGLDLRALGLSAGLAFLTCALFALAAAFTAASSLFGLKPYGPVTLIAAAALLAGVALAAAGFRPAAPQPSAL